MNLSFFAVRFGRQPRPKSCCSPGTRGTEFQRSTAKRVCARGGRRLGLILCFGRKAVSPETPALVAAKRACVFQLSSQAQRRRKH